eukprot:5673867-Alexandrium_andersonii.AAC.1
MLQEALRDSRSEQEERGGAGEDPAEAPRASSSRLAPAAAPVPPVGAAEAGAGTNPVEEAQRISRQEQAWRAQAG